MSNRDNSIWNLAHLGAPVVTSPPSLRAIAVAVFRAVETGDTDVVRRHVARNLVQHNVLVPDGRDALIKIIEESVSLNAKCQVLRLFGDMDHVVIHNRIIIGDFDLVGIDLFRFKDGQIVEHWQNRNDFVEKDGDPLCLVNGQTEVRDYDSTEENALNVLQGIANVANNPDRNVLYSYYHPDIEHHNPYLESGAAALVKFQDDCIKKGIWDGKTAYYKTVCEGDFVFLMSEVVIKGHVCAIFEILRFDGQLVVERWDVVERVPPETDWVGATNKF